MYDTTVVLSVATKMVAPVTTVEELDDLWDIFLPLSDFDVWVLYEPLLSYSSTSLDQWLG